MSDVIVVGAGLAGLTAALRLAEAGYRVRIFERYPEAGGLARVFEVGGERLESFYHHLFTSDAAYVALAEELGLGDCLEWRASRMGIWTEGRLWDFGTPMSLLRFGPLTMADKIRFAISTLRLQHQPDPTPYEHATAAEWILRHQGERVWRSVWAPLFYQKFAERADEVAMVWLWGKMRLRGRSRSRSGLGEELGYMRGSFARLVDAMVERLGSVGCELCLGDPVRSIQHRAAGLTVLTRSGEYRADRVVAAVQLANYLEIAGALLPAVERERLGRLGATSAICTVLELEHSLTPYYWLNIADESMPFGGLIEHTNFVPRERYDGRHILYISNYLLPDNPLFNAPEDQVLEEYLPALARINPAFDPSWVLGSHHFRARSAQPIVTRGYRDLIPAMRTSVPGLYLVTMSQIYPEDRGQNYAISYGERVAKCVIGDDAVTSQA